jgi:hypothetical protein
MLPTRGGQTEATVANPLSASPPLTVNGGDRMYHQLVEIHAIAATQLAECAHWHQSRATTSPVWARAGRQRPTVTPSATGLASMSPMDFPSHDPLWR